ncbi:MAG: thioredoxin [Gaiellales bacterium]
MGVEHVTDATFAAEVEKSSTPVLVDFWAEWCGPCRAMNPILEDFASAHEGRMRVVKLNIDENPEAAARFQVMSIPTMLVFKDGAVVKQLVGAMQRPKLEEHLTEWIGAPA